MSLDTRTESAETPDGVIFLPENNGAERLPAVYATAVEAAAAARQTAENLRALAKEYADMADRWDDRADVQDETAQRIRDRHLGGHALSVIE